MRPTDYQKGVVGKKRGSLVLILPPLFWVLSFIELERSSTRQRSTSKKLAVAEACVSKSD